MVHYLGANLDYVNLDLNSEEQLKKFTEVPLNKMSRRICDEVIIATAFAELLLLGRIESDIKQFALEALWREQTSTILAQRGWVDKNARVQVLARTQQIFERAPE